jgi:hypothetical protein
MDLDMGSLFSSMLIGCVGMGYFMYGKKASRLYPLIAGILMFVYPYFVPYIWLQWVICIALMVACWFVRDQ